MVGGIDERYCKAAVFCLCQNMFAGKWGERSESTIHELFDKRLSNAWSDKEGDVVMKDGDGVVPSGRQEEE